MTSRNDPQVGAKRLELIERSLATRIANAGDPDRPGSFDALRDSSIFQHHFSVGYREGFGEGFEKGQEEGLKAGMALVLRAATKRLGHPADGLIQCLTTISDTEQILAIAEGAFHVDSWNELFHEP